MLRAVRVCSQAFRCDDRPQDFLRQPDELSRWLTLEPPWEEASAAPVQVLILAAELEVDVLGDAAVGTQRQPPEAAAEQQLGAAAGGAGGCTEVGGTTAALAVIDALLLGVLRRHARSEDRTSCL